MGSARRKKKQNHRKFWAAVCIAAAVALPFFGKAVMGQSSNTTASASPSADTYDGSSPETVQLAEQGFLATNAKISSTEVHSWDMINHKFESEDTLSEIAGRILQEFSLSNAKIVKTSDKSEHFYEIYGQRSTGEDASVILSSFKFSSEPSQTILIIRADSEKPNLRQLTREYKLIGATERQLGFSPQISACIKGFTNDRISGGSKESIENEVLQAVNAKRVEGIDTQNVTSISGFSPNCDNYILTQGRKMNLQLGLHYDSTQQRTEVVVGAPFITITY